MDIKTEDTVGATPVATTAIRNLNVEQSSTPPFPDRVTGNFNPEVTLALPTPNPSVSSTVPKETPKEIPTPKKGYSANEFAQACGFFGGPTARIIIGARHLPKTYTLPRAYLASQSATFYNYFETGQTTITFSEDKPEIFELVIQWIYTGCVVLLPCMIPLDSPENVIKHYRELVTTYLDFFHLCDRLEISEEGQEGIILEVKSLLRLCRKALSRAHIRSVIDLPTGHALRKLFAQATAKDFVLSKGKDQGPYVFEIEVIDKPQYAADLLIECGYIIANISLTSKTLFGCGAVQGPFSIDPLTDQEFSMSSSPTESSLPK